MSRSPEKRIVQDPLTKFMREHGVTYKTRDVSQFTTNPGWPDLDIFPGKGIIKFIECKVGDRQPTELQAHVHKTLREAGYEVEVVNDPEVGKKLIRRWCKL